MHKTVFLHEAVAELQVSKGNKYIDATYGEGGHYELLVEAGGVVLGIDRDEEQVKKGLAKGHTVVLGMFKHIVAIAKQNNFLPVDGVLFDLGLSYEQVSDSKKGLSYQNNEEVLDMRLDKDAVPAWRYLLQMTNDELSEVFARFSEDPISYQLAQKVTEERRSNPIETVKQLKKCIDEIMTNATKKEREQTYARIFQSLRIVVNDEYNQLKKGLEGALQILKKNGKIVVISFHSGEDRIVKRFAKKTSQTTMKIVDIKRIRSLEQYERSATLRVIEKI